MANPRIEELDDNDTQDVQVTKNDDASSDSEGSDNEGGEGTSYISQTHRKKRGSRQSQTLRDHEH